MTLLGKGAVCAINWTSEVHYIIPRTRREYSEERKYSAGKADV